MSWKFKIFNLFRQPAPKNAATPEKYLPYGPKDDFPIAWSTAITNSPSAASCLSTIKDFLEGDDFSDPTLSKLVVNSKKETFWDIHRKVVADDGEFYGFYLLFRYSIVGKITEIIVLPFQNCRLGVPDDNGFISKIYYNPFFGTSEYKGKIDKHTVIYDVFNPDPAVIQRQMQESKNQKTGEITYKGQVFFWGTTTALSPYYPVNEAYSAMKWMKIESGVSDYHEDNLNNGFLQPFMLIMKGDPNQVSSNPDHANFNGEGRPKTQAQEFEEIISENFMGAKRVGNMFVQWVSQGEEAPEAVQLPANNNGDLFVTLDNQSTKKITIAWKVPAILANINEGVSLGGDGNSVRVAVKLMQQRVRKRQRILTDIYEKILKNFVTPYLQEVNITPYNPYPEMEVLDEKIWGAMTLPEQRKYIQENTEIELDEIEPEPAEDPGLEAPQTAKLLNAVMVKFPERVLKNVKEAISYHDKMGIKCQGKGGRELSEKILQNSSIGLKEAKRIYNYLKKNEIHSNKPFNEGCNVILYQAWGGKEMKDFLEAKIEDINAWLN